MASVNRTSPVLRAFAVVCVAAFSLVSCASDEPSTGTVGPTPTPTTVSATEPTSGVSVEGQWARTSPMSAQNGAAYATFTCATDDALTAAAVDTAVAEKVELHETVMTGMTGDTAMGMGSGMATTMPSGGEMTMRPVERIECAAGVPVELAPGGFHLMLFGLANPLVVGDTLSVTLTFEHAGEVVVEVPVLEAAP